MSDKEKEMQQPRIRYSCIQFHEHNVTIDADTATTYQPACRDCVPHLEGAGDLVWSESGQTFWYVLPPLKEVRP